MSFLQDVGSFYMLLIMSFKGAKFVFPEIFFSQLEVRTWG